MANALLGSGHFEEAEAVLTDGIGRFPLDPRFVADHERLTAAKEALNASQPSTSLELPASTALEHADVGAIKEIIKHFDSLGGMAVGCEFGLFQRLLSYEPHWPFKMGKFGI